MHLSRRAAVIHLAAAIAVASGLTPLAATGRDDVSQSGAVTITAHYKGQGTVDATHKIWIWVFDTPDIGPSAMPLREESVAVNGGSVVIDGLGSERVWIAVAFDERGNSPGNTPPAPGSPIGIYSADGRAPTGLTTADRPTAVVTFDDSLRMP